MGKRQEAAKLTRERIVQAAKKLHEARGLTNVSVDEIVAEAGVSKGSFYVYFRRKEDIAQDIAFRKFDSIKEDLEHFSGTTAEKIGRFITESVRYIEGQGLALCKEWMKGAVCPMGEDCSGMKKLNYDRDYILQTLEAGIDTGSNSEAVNKALADIIMAEYYGCVCMWSMTDGSFPMQQRMEQFAATLDGMLKQ